MTLAQLRARVGRRLTMVTVVLALLAGNGLVWQASRVAFSGTTSNPNNTAVAGTVSLTDDDASDTKVLFNLSNLIPGDTTSACMTVTYTGTLPGLVNLFGTTTGSGLGTYLNLTVTRGTISSGSFGDCTNFTPDATNYTGAGAGVIYNSTLAAFPATYGTGIADPKTSTIPEAWTVGETHSYKFETVLQDNDAAQGKTATTAFTWQTANTALYSQVVRSDLPGSYWKLDETVGTTAVDAMGVVNGTYANSPAIGQTSAPKDAGTSIKFQELNTDVVNVGDYYDFVGYAPYTIECWIKPTPNNGYYRRIIAKDDAWTLWMFADSWKGVGFQRAYTDGVEYLTTISSTSWHHVVVTFDGTTSRMYFDGTLSASNPTGVALPNSGQPLTFGESGPGNAQGLGGGLDEVAIYSYALTAAQVTSHWVAGSV